MGRKHSLCLHQISNTLSSFQILANKYILNSWIFWKILSPETIDRHILLLETTIQGFCCFRKWCHLDKVPRFLTPSLLRHNLLLFKTCVHRYLRLLPIKSPPILLFMMEGPIQVFRSCICWCNPLTQKFHLKRLIVSIYNELFSEILPKIIRLQSIYRKNRENLQKFWKSFKQYKN